MTITSLLFFFTGHGGAEDRPAPKPPNEQHAEAVNNQYLELSLSELMSVNTTTAAKINEKAFDAAASIIVVTKRQIRERGYVNLADLLEDLPGVKVSHKANEEYFNQIAIRGNVGNNKFIIQQDGIRINSPTGEQIPISDNFPLFHAEQVEVIYGPASSLYGADAFTGIINIITKKAKNVDGVELSTAFGSDDYFYNYLNFGKAISEMVDLTFGGHWHGSQNPDLSKTYPDKFGKTDLLTTSGTVFRKAADREPYVAPTESYSVYANIEIGKRLTLGMTESFLNHPSTTSNQPRNAMFTKDAVWETRIDNYFGKYKFNIYDNLSSESLVNYSKYELDPASGFTNSFADFRSYKYARGDKLKLEQQLNYKITKEHELVGGVSYEDFEDIPKTADLPSRFNTSRDEKNQGFFYLGTNNTLPLKIFDIYYQNYGGYLQAQSKWNDWFTTTAGFRFDHDTRFGDTVNPRAGGVFKPGKDTVVKLLYGEAFLAPTGHDSYEHFGSFNGTKNADGKYVSDFFHLPNPKLQPEKSRTTELNLIHNITQDFIVSGNVYYSRVNNMLGTVFKNETSTYIDGGIINSYETTENIGIAKLYGAEFKTDYQTRLDKTNLKFWGSYSWVEGTINEPGGLSGPLPLTARNMIKGGVTANYAEKYVLTPRIVWVDKTNNFRSLRSEKVDAYTLVNLHGEAIDFYDKLSAFADVHNLLDVKYYSGTSSVQEFPASPQDPRRIFFGLKYKF